jgi:Flp pilus assembly protein TadB
MTPDEYRRLEIIERRQAIAEERDRVADERMQRMESRSERMEGKLDQLLTLFSMGKGAVWVLTVAGGFLVMVAGAVAWAADHFRWWIK